MAVRSGAEVRRYARPVGPTSGPMLCGRTGRPTPRPVLSSTGDGAAHELRPRPSPDHRRRRRRASTGTARLGLSEPGAAAQRLPPGPPLEATEQSCRPLDRQRRRTPSRAQHDALRTKRSHLAAHRPPRRSARPAASPSQLIGNRLSNRLPRHNFRLARDHRQRPTLDLLCPCSLATLVALVHRTLKTREQLGSQLRPLIVSQRQSLAPNILSPRCHGQRLTHSATRAEGTPTQRRAHCPPQHRRRVPGPKLSLPNSTQQGRDQGKQSLLRESNSRPFPYHGNALPTELRRQPHPKSGASESATVESTIKLARPDSGRRLLPRA